MIKKTESELELMMDEFIKGEYLWDYDETSRTAYYDLHADYRDIMQPETAIAILQSDDPEMSFQDKIFEWWDDEATRCIDEVRDKFMQQLDAAEIEYDEDCVRDYFNEHLYANYPDDHYLKQTFQVPIMVDTGDGNYDYVLNCVYPHYNGQQGEKIDDCASLVWLAKQQGYTKTQLSQALNQGDMSSPEGFLESVRVEVANMASHMATLTFLVELTLEELIRINKAIKWRDSCGPFYDARKNPYCGYLLISKSVDCGLYCPWSGGGSVLEIQLDKDVRLPVKYIRSALPDGGDGYSLNNTYGLCGKAWKNGSVTKIHIPSHCDVNCA